VVEVDHGWNSGDLELGEVDKRIIELAERFSRTIGRSSRIR
jgi:hypothetical protein